MNRLRIQDYALKVEYLASQYSQDNTGEFRVPLSQRQWAWNGKRGRSKMVKLIDSVMTGFPIPSVILNKVNGYYDIYDGRHRIETLSVYRNNNFKWNGRLYSELSEEERERFDERTIPVTVVRNATTSQLADMFIRLNNGAPLRDSDLLWANRDTALVRAVLRLITRNARLSIALGGLDLTTRSDLANWTGLLCGLSTGNPGNMTCSYLRISSDIGLDHEVDETAVNDGLDVLCDLLERANTEFPAQDKLKRQLKKIGAFTAYFIADYKSSPNDETIRKWINIIGRLRGNTTQRDAMKNALTVSGAQNLTNDKIEQVLEQVNRYIRDGVVRNGDDDDDDDDESV